MELRLSDLHSNAELTHEVAEILYNRYENDTVAVLELRQNNELWIYRQLELLSRPSPTWYRDRLHHIAVYWHSALVESIPLAK